MKGKALKKAVKKRKKKEKALKKKLKKFKKQEKEKQKKSIKRKVKKLRKKLKRLKKYSKKETKRVKKKSSSEEKHKEESKEKKRENSKEPKNSSSKKKEGKKPSSDVIENGSSSVGPSIDMMVQQPSNTPMTKEEWEKQESVVRRVYDNESGRHRLIKGSGEVMEEIVSRDRHRAINKSATQNDGEYFQSSVKSRASK